MVVDDFNVMRAIVMPCKTDPPLVMERDERDGVTLITYITCQRPYWLWATAARVRSATRVQKKEFFLFSMADLLVGLDEGSAVVSACAFRDRRRGYFLKIQNRIVSTTEIRMLVVRGK
jgi:hypothetical protein